MTATLEERIAESRQAAQELVSAIERATALINGMGAALSAEAEIRALARRLPPRHRSPHRRRRHGRA